MNQALKTARELKKMTLKELSALTNIPVTLLDKIERETAPLSPLFASVIADALNIGKDTLYEDGKGYIEKTTVIGMAIHKGGSGKSSVCVNLGYALSELGYRILLIDTDSQKNITGSYDMEESDKNFYHAFLKDEPIEKHIQHTAYERIDMVVGASALSDISEHMPFMSFREIRMNSILEGVKASNKYDFILLDTNPSLGMYNTCLFYGCDKLIIPMEPGEFEIKGLDAFVQHYGKMKKYKPELEILGIVANKVDKRTNICSDVISIIEEVFGDYVFKTRIPMDTNIRNAHWHHAPLKVYNRTSKAVKAFDELAVEILHSLEKGQK